MQLEIKNKARLLELYSIFEEELALDVGIKYTGTRVERRLMATRDTMEQAFELCKVSSVEIETFDPNGHQATEHLPSRLQLQEAIRLSRHSRQYGLPEQPEDAKERDRLFLGLPMPTAGRAQAINGC